MNIFTPEGIANYFESLKKVQQTEFEKQLQKNVSFTPAPKKRKKIGFNLDCKEETK